MAKFTKFGSLNTSFQKFLNSSWLLYLVFFLGAADLYIFAVNGELFFVALFVLIGFLTTFFSKNMVVILMVAMTLTNIFRFGKNVTVHEGMENGEANNGATTGGKDSDEGGDYQFLDKEGDDGKTKPKTKKADAATTDATTDAPSQKMTDIGETPKPPLIESVVAGKDASSSSKVEKFTDVAAAASPAGIAATADEITDKIAGLDKDTLTLLQKQQKLMESMENLNPLLKKAETFLERFKNMPHAK